MARLRRVRLSGGPYDGREVTVDCSIAFVTRIRGRVRSITTPSDLDLAGGPGSSECYSPDNRAGSDPDLFHWRPRTHQEDLASTPGPWS